MFGDMIVFWRQKARLKRRAQLFCQTQNLDPPALIASLLKEGNIFSSAPMKVSGRLGMAAYTPLQLAPFLERLCEYPAEGISLVLGTPLGRVVMSNGLPISVAGDIMMGLEFCNYVLPAKGQAAAKLLAYSLCMGPLLSLARSTYKNLGRCFEGARLSSAERQILVKQGFGRAEDESGESTSRGVPANTEMREMVTRALLDISRDNRRLFGI